MSCSKPAKRARPPCRIDELSDADLEEIFKRLPPFERLIVSEVCPRWHGISVPAWHDIKRLDLSRIPGEYICAVIKKCPNLRSCFASEKDFGWRETACLATAPNLSCVKFYHCNFRLVATLLDDPSDIHNIFREIFSRNGQVQWQEFVLSDAWLDRPKIPNDSPKWSLDLSFLSASLTRLQLTGLRCDFADDPCEGRFLEGLEHLQNLECLILLSTALPGYVDADNPRDLIHNGLWDVEDVFEKIGKLKHLRELCISLTTSEDVALLLSRLPKLEVLFLWDVADLDPFNDEDADVFKELITKNSVLRILVLTGYVYSREPIELPVRKRFPNGFGSDPLPLLHIFVGKYAAKTFHFGRSSSDAAIILPIDKPMPEFLERADIAPVFDGVWVSERIKETARNDSLLWFYDKDTVDSLHFI